MADEDSTEGFEPKYAVVDKRTGEQVKYTLFEVLEETEALVRKLRLLGFDKDQIFFSNRITMPGSKCPYYGIELIVPPHHDLHFGLFPEPVVYIAVTADFVVQCPPEMVFAAWFEYNTNYVDGDAEPTPRIQGLMDASTKLDKLAAGIRKTGLKIPRESFH